MLLAKATTDTSNVHYVYLQILLYMRFVENYLHKWKLLAAHMQDRDHCVISLSSWSWSQWRR